MKNSKKFLLILAVLVIGGISFAYFGRNTETKPTYISFPVNRGDIEENVLSAGTVQPENRLDIKPPIGGRVEKILVVEGDHVRAGQIVAWMSSQERAALLDAARGEGAESLKYWEELYQPTPIIAPLTGTIIQRNIQPGQTFQASDAIFVEANRLVFEGYVDETDIAQVKVGMPTEIRLDAYAQNPIKGKVVHISYDAKIINSVTNYFVHVLPENQPDFMRSGMTANLKFFVGRHANVLTIPMEAVTTLEGGKKVVLVPGPEEKPPVQRLITLGINDGKRVEVKTGLTEQDTVLMLEVKRKGHASKASSPFGAAPAAAGGD